MFARLKSQLCPGQFSSDSVKNRLDVLSAPLVGVSVGAVAQYSDLLQDGIGASLSDTPKRLPF
jgi:hypothetical protein